MFPDLNSTSAKLFERACKSFPGGSTRHPVMYKPYVLYAAKGEGCRIVDVDGVERIDFVNNFSSLIHGHAHPGIVEAATNQIRSMTCSTMPTESTLQLAELLIERIPCVETVIFGNSGTEAVLFGVKAARAYTGRSKIAKIEGGYHGQFDLIQHSFTSTPDNWGPEDAHNTVPLDMGTPREVLDLLVTLSPNNVEASRAVLRRHAHELAAVLVDPIPQRLSANPLTADYLAMLREETTRLGIVLIFDEVIALRAGYHGAQGVFRVTPDLTTMGKIMGGGFPIGALGGKKEIMSVFDATEGDLRVFFGGTYSSNPVSMVAGYTAMTLLTPAVFDRLETQGNRLRKGIVEAGKIADIAVGVGGVASMTHVFLSDRPYLTYRESVEGMSADYMTRLGKLHMHLLNEGVLISPQGHYYASTPMSDEDIDFTIEATYRSFKKLTNEPS
ncbi:MAG: aspartate aminotransferase family protein [Deltaproteobacteria bacterium]|nr:aspartate aminotransferase family protein [Deltaproteobacteria bacterium]